MADDSSVLVEENVGPRTQVPRRDALRSQIGSVYVPVVIVAALIYLGCIVSPPSLMDDTDAVQAQIARNMLTSRDWVTAHLDGVPYLEKAPAVYWSIALSYKVFGVHDWAARIPIALSAIGLCWLTAAFGCWAFDSRAGLYAGLTMACCVGLFLFTRVLIPDVMLTFTVAVANWALLRALDENEPHPRAWSLVLAVSLGVGLLLKSLIALVFPLGTGLVYLYFTHQLSSRQAWKRLHPLSGLVVVLLIAAPWHLLATLGNPPYFAWTLHSGPGQYHGFLWFYFINEQLLRFLNLRYPRDYNTVPRALFWLLHLVWLFPWSVYFPAVAKASFLPTDRAGRTRLLALCWAGFVLVFFTFSTTQEYYSMPCYPALALLLGSGIARGGIWIRRGTRVLAAICGLATITVLAILLLVRGLPAPGDISSALSRHPKAYSLSLGHIQDLTLASFAYLRMPLVVATAAFAIGALGTLRRRHVYLTATLMMIVFFHAARLAMVTFDPFLSSRPLVRALERWPEGKLIVDRHYYPFSSVFFYTGRDALLLNGKFHNLEYGGNAPGAPPVFIDDAGFQRRWLEPQRYYLFAKASELPRFEKLVGDSHLNLVSASGGKLLLANRPMVP